MIENKPNINGHSSIKMQLCILSLHNLFCSKKTRCYCTQDAELIESMSIIYEIYPINGQVLLNDQCQNFVVSPRSP